ncbi:hypothetical protein KBC79_01840 [Candidatus Woesebacteria bacterium]|nr:hypothetical protein [Candidatus Woesebacteria bacterium]
MPSSYSPLMSAFEYSLASFVSVLPKLAGAALVMVLGLIAAHILRQLLRKLLEQLHLTEALEKTPLEHFAKEANRERKLEHGIATIAYWLVVLIVADTVVEMLGLTPVSLVLDQVLLLLPRIVSAGVVLLVGVFFAGILENVAKAVMRSVSVRMSRAFGKVTSYSIITVAILAALSELGIAREFILILFMGFVGSTALGVGLALGLGGQELVRTMLKDWYNRMEREAKRT